MKKITLLLLAITFSVTLFGQSLLDQPKPTRLVNDYAGIFSDSERTMLERRLVALDDSTSNQVLLVTTPDLEGMDISALATELGHKWGVGHDGKDNGVVILVKPKTQSSNGAVFIAVGYGLEGVIPDAVAKMIVEREMIPYFARGDMFGGVNAAVGTISSLASSEFSADQYMKKAKGNNSMGANVLVVLFVLFMIIMLIPRKKSVDVNGDGAEVHTSILPWLIIGSMGRGGGHGGGFGGGGGGGFGGFGGGGFGGGGAGGSW